MNLGLWRDVALIFLIVQALVLSLVPLLVLWGAAFYLRKLPPYVRRFFSRARALLARVHMGAEQMSATISAPLVAAYALTARAGAWKRYITRELRR